MRLLLLFFIYSLHQLHAASTSELPIMNEQQRKLYEELKNLDKSIPSSNLSSIKKADIVADTNETVCFMTHSITLKNSRLIRESIQKKLIEPYLEKCNGITSLNTLANSFNRYYFEHGYITSRVYIPPQDISNGVVELTALEGKIETIISDNRKTAGAFMLMEGDALNLTDLESALGQINRMRSAQTRMELVPGREAGGSTVILNNREKSPFFGFVGVNNYGIVSTGKIQLSGGFIWENLFGFSDILTLNINTTDKRKAGQNSLGNGVSYSIPLGKWLWEGSISRFRYTQTIKGLNENYLSEGISDEISLGSRYKAYHTRTMNFELQSKVSHKKVQSWINKAYVSSSSYDITVGSVGAKWIYRQPSWEVYVIPDYHHGLNWYSPTPNGSLQHDFSKWTLALGTTKHFETSQITYQLAGYAQQSADLLYGNEQISIGGAYSVRGFQRRNISGSTGGYLRNDLIFRGNELFSPYIAYDTGYIREASDTEGGRLSSATLGFRSHYGAFDLDVYHAIPLSSPNADNFGSDPFIGVNLSANF